MKKYQKYLLLLLLFPFLASVGVFIFLAYDFIRYQADGHAGSRPPAPTSGFGLLRDLPLGMTEGAALEAVRRHQAFPYDEPNDYVFHLFQYFRPGNGYWPKFSDGVIEIHIVDGRVSDTHFDFWPAPQNLPAANGILPAPDCRERFLQAQSKLHSLFGPPVGAFQIADNPVAAWPVTGGRLYLSAVMDKRFCSVSANTHPEGDRACQDSCHRNAKP